MKAILQRVSSASVTVDNKLISQISRGILVFAAIGKNDTPHEVEKVADKIVKLKLWDDETERQGAGKWKRSVKDIDGEVLCVSQFTLLASLKKGNKPDFHKSAAPEVARDLWRIFVRRVREGYKTERVKEGMFQAMMEVRIVNDGPVTFEIEVEPLAKLLVAKDNDADGTSIGKEEGAS